MIPESNETPYMSFIFGLIFCILNSMQGFFIFISCHVLKKIKSKEEKETQSSSSNAQTGSTVVRTHSEFTNMKPSEEFEVAADTIADKYE